MEGPIAGAPADARAALLRSHEAVLATYAETARRRSDPEARKLAALLFRRGEQIRQAYTALLPEVPVSRCPFTAQELVMRIDVTDIDGLWWRYHEPLRITGDRPRTLIAITGALALGPMVPATSFLVKPGPQVPYVIPRLVDAGATGVLSLVRIGPHTGYVVAYFAPDPERVRARANEWGSSGYTRIAADGSLEWGAAGEDPSEWDFDLGSWIDRGNLRWIAPGDRSLTVRTGRAGCPYVGLTGPRAVSRIEGGRVR